MSKSTLKLLPTIIVGRSVVFIERTFDHVLHIF